MLFFILISSFL